MGRGGNSGEDCGGEGSSRRGEGKVTLVTLTRGGGVHIVSLFHEHDALYREWGIVDISFGERRGCENQVCRRPRVRRDRRVTGALLSRRTRLVVTKSSILSDQNGILAELNMNSTVE